MSDDRSSGPVHTFTDLCERPLGTGDYLRLTRDRMSLALIGVPDLATAGAEPLQRFATLIAIVYDRDIRLDVVAASAPDAMRAAGRPPADTERTLSRLSMLRAGASSVAGFDTPLVPRGYSTSGRTGSTTRDCAVTAGEVRVPARCCAAGGRGFRCVVRRCGTVSGG
ncbi:hypothetical protein GCM10009624_11460 [Gordonia sinesedis]